MSRTSFAPRAARFAVLLAAAISLGALASAPAHAQAVVASVNDDPVTNVDIEQHMKILRVIQKNATREAALESIYETRLKLMEMSKYKVNPGDPDIGWALGITARRLKTDPQSMVGALQRAGVTEDQWKQKWKSEAGWMHPRSQRDRGARGAGEIRPEQSSRIYGPAGHSRGAQWRQCGGPRCGSEPVAGPFYRLRHWRSHGGRLS